MSILKRPRMTALSYGQIGIAINVDYATKSWLAEEDVNYRDEAKRVLQEAYDELEQVTLAQLVSRADPKFNRKLIAQYIDSMS